MYSGQSKTLLANRRSGALGDFGKEVIHYDGIIKFSVESDNR